MNSLSIIEIKSKLKPCPFCGCRVIIKDYCYTYYGGMQMTFECSCGMVATFNYNPPGHRLETLGGRDKLKPWEQWNERSGGGTNEQDGVFF